MKVLSLHINRVLISVYTAHLDILKVGYVVQLS